MLRYRRWTFRMREGKKEQRPNLNHATRRRRACVYFYRNANTCPDFSDSPVLQASRSPLGLCHSSLVYCLERVGSTFWCIGSVWHLQGSREENEVRCQRRTRLLNFSIGGASAVSSGASADLLSRSSHGRSGCAVSSLRKPENGAQSTRLFFRFHTTISQCE